MRLFIFISLLFLAFPCQAQIKEYQHLYDINPDEEIPMLWRLQKEYRKFRSDYDWHYDYNWNIPPVFDKEFAQNIERFGKVEKRIDNPDEEDILRELRRLPPEFYPYIGPVLHTLPGLSGKVLDLPGIKETKHQFPKRIASKLAAIPDIEFLSPGLYIYLMPELFGEGSNTREFPQSVSKYPNLPPIRIKKELLAAALKEVPPENFAIDKPEQPEDLGIRHYSADAGTPLSKADVQAFIATIDGLANFSADLKTKVKYISLNSLMNYWDEKNGTDKNVAFLKTMVNPCQTLARKIKWLGDRSQFQDVISPQAFGLDDWAYTCDKTLKALRAVSQSNAEITAMNIAKKGYIYDMINQTGYYTPEERQAHKYFIEASIQLYQTTPENKEAVRPYAAELNKKLAVFGANLLGSPLILP